MAVANDGSGTPSVASGTSPLTISTFTVGTGANRCLVGMLMAAAGAISNVTMTWHSVSMTLHKQFDPASGYHLFFFKLVAPDSGNFNLVATWTGGQSAAMQAWEGSGVDQTTPLKVADDATASGTSTSANITVTSDTSGATVAFSGNTAAFYTAQTQTLIDNVNTGSIAMDATYALGGTSNVHGFTLPSATWASAGVHVQAVLAVKPTGPFPTYRHDLP